MKNSVEMTGTSGNCVVFSVWVDGHRYDCPVALAALYEICKGQDPGADRIDAYLALKARIRRAVERRIRQGSGDAEEILDVQELLH